MEARGVTVLENCSQLGLNKLSGLLCGSHHVHSVGSEGFLSSHDIGHSRVLNLSLGFLFGHSKLSYLLFGQFRVVDLAAALHHDTVHIHGPVLGVEALFSHTLSLACLLVGYESL